MPQSAGQFGKYQLLDRIAAGGMAEIYRARQTGAAGVTKSVVIKKILRHQARNRAFISMFINEAKIAMGLSHGNIAQIFDFGEIEGEYFLAMEYVDGQPLSKVLERARSLRIPVMPPSFAVLVAIELCKGLHYAHTRRDDEGGPLHIIHRDVSPQNVMISYEGQVKIVDFGIAKARTAGQSETITGAVKGKYVYFAPEQARGKELDARTDTFAAGVVLYEMLCGRLPAEGKMMKVLSQIARGDFPTPRSLNPDLSPALERIVLTAMALEKEQRYPTCQAFGEALASHLYADAPSFSASSLCHYMEHLFEPELQAEGRPVTLPPSFLEQLPRWRKPLPAPPQEKKGAARPRGMGPGLDEETHTEIAASRMCGHSRRHWLFIGAPLLAAALAAAGVVLSVRLGTFTLRLESNPPGASITIDGQPSGNVTPQLISRLAASRKHRIEVLAPGRKPWVREVVAERGALVQLTAELKPEQPSSPATPEPPRPEPPPIPEPPAARPPDEVAGSARYPVSSIRLAAAQHSLSVPASRAARIRLDPKRSYRVWTEGRMSLGGRPYLNQAIYFLDGPDLLPAKESLGVLSPAPTLIKNASMLYAFVLASPTDPSTGALRVRLQDRRSKRVFSLPVQAGKQAILLKDSQRFLLTDLDPLASYQLEVKEGPDPARTQAGKRGRVGKLVYSQDVTLSALGGKRWGNDTQRVLEVGKTYRMGGAAWMSFTLLDDDLADNRGALDIEIRGAPPPGR